MLKLPAVEGPVNMELNAKVIESNKRIQEVAEKSKPTLYETLPSIFHGQWWRLVGNMVVWMKYVISTLHTFTFQLDFHI